jgi:lysophospholipase L1-like esterase
MRLRAAHLALAALIAALVLAAGCAGLATPTAPVAVVVDPVSSPAWADDMRRFAAEDVAKPPPKRPIVFTGSSSIRMWRSLAEDFPGLPVLNRGFGGSQLRDVVHYADQVAIHYRPRMILVYGGDNDIDAGRRPQQVLSDFRALVARVRRDLPKVPIAYLSIKPSPSRASQLPAQGEANALVRAEAAKWPHVQFIDVATPMLDADGQPRAELFTADRLHMNSAGYALWRQIVSPYLK